MRDVYFIGVDSGTQSTKVSIINQRGETHLSSSQPLRPMLTRQTGWVEHPDDDLWDSTKAALKELMASFKGDVSDIKGIGLCSIRNCRVFLKKDGSLAAPVMSWMDVRAYLPFEDEPDIGYTGSTSGYLTFRLTGELKDTIANQYQYQFPVDMETWKWIEDPEAFSAFRIPRPKLLDMYLPGEILGRVSAAAAAETGLPEGIPVIATANDKAVEALGSGLIEHRVALLSLGTYIASMVAGERNCQIRIIFSPTYRASRTGICMKARVFGGACGISPGLRASSVTSLSGRHADQAESRRNCWRRKRPRFLQAPMAS